MLLFGFSYSCIPVKTSTLLMLTSPSLQVKSLTDRHRGAETGRLEYFGPERATQDGGRDTCISTHLSLKQEQFASRRLGVLRGSAQVEYKGH